MARFISRRIDDLDFEVIHCGIRTVTEEMTAVMERTARSPEHFAGRDYSMGIFDGKGNTVCLYEGNPIHLWAVPYAVRAAIDFFGDDIHPGDSIWVNDPYTGGAGSHLPDASMLSPVFYEDNLMFWVANRAHQVDIGGAAAGGYNPTATEILAEGVRYPPLKIEENFELRKDAFNLIMANMRFASKQRGDLFAMIGANRRGEKGLLRFLERYGIETINFFLEDLYDYTEELLRNEIEKLPDGVYFGEAKGEGGPRCPTYTVRVKVTVKGSEMTVDFSESDAQVPVYINSPISNTVTCTYIALMTSIGKDMKYRSEGIARPVNIITKPGTITDPVVPAPVGTCTNFCAKQIIEAIWSIFADILPESTPAGWGTVPFEILVGTDPRANDAPYGSVDFLTCGSGTGAIWGTDGWATGAPQITSGALHYPDIEVYEEVLPNRWDVWEMQPDSGAPGRWRGGNAMKAVITNIGGEGWVHTGGQGFRNDTLPVPAVAGGKKPKPAKRWIIEPDGTKTDANDIESYPWRPGAQLTVLTQGGCGVGNPFEREVEAVRKDVIEEKVSVEAAAREYGVAINPETFDVDEEKTKELRAG